MAELATAADTFAPSPIQPGMLIHWLRDALRATPPVWRRT
jgi:hypothetical protein